jgi:hypothetical protein
MMICICMCHKLVSVKLYIVETICRAHVASLFLRVTSYHQLIKMVRAKSHWIREQDRTWIKWQDEALNIRWFAQHV